MRSSTSSRRTARTARSAPPTAGDFPALVAAAPKGLFLTGTPVRRARRRHGHRTPDAVLRRPDDARHAHRLVHRLVPADRARVATADPGDDVPAAQRRPRLGQAARPDTARTRAATRPARHGPGRDRRGPARLQGRPSTTGSTTRLTRSHPSTRASGRSATSCPAQQGAPADLRRRLGAPRLARAGRRPRRLHPAAGIPGEALTARDLVEAGLYTLPEFLVPTMLDYAPPALAAAMVPLRPAGRRDMVPGFLRARHRKQPGLACLPGHA